MISSAASSTVVAVTLTSNPGLSYIVHDVSDLGGCKTDLLQLLVMGKYLFRCVVVQDLSFVHDNDPVRIFCNVLHAVGHKDHRHIALPVQVCDLVQYLVPALWIQAGSGLVQHKDAGAHGQDTCNGRPPLLSAGQLKGGGFPVFFLQPHKAQRLCGSLFTFLRSKPLVLRAKAHIRQHIHLEKLMLRVLEDKPHLAAELPHIVPFRVNVFSVVKDRAAGGPYETVQMLGQCGFPGPGVADDAHKLPVRDLKADVRERLLLVGCARAVYIIDVF